MSEPHVDSWMVISSFYPHIGGAERQAHRLSRELGTLGWQAAVLTRRHSPLSANALAAREDIEDVTVHRVASRGPGKVAALGFLWNGLWHLLRAGRGGIYHAHDLGAPALLSMLARILTGGRCLVKIRSGRTQYRETPPSLFRRLQLGAMRRWVDCFVVVSREGEALLLEKGIPNDRIAFIANGVDTTVFRPEAPDRKAQLREELGLPADEFVALYVGRLEPVKGVDVLVEAWARLPADARGRSMLIVVGDGPERSRLQERVAEEGLERRVVFGGQREDVLSFLQTADAFVLPSRSEGLSNALLEAMACELPVVCSAVGGTLDMVRPNETGLLFESEDVQDLAGALASLIETPERFRQMGAAAREAVEARASLRQSAQRLKETYQRLARRGG